MNTSQLTCFQDQSIITTKIIGNISGFCLQSEGSYEMNLYWQM